MENSDLIEKEAEAGILACCLIDAGSLAICIDSGMEHFTFFEGSHRMIFAAMVETSNEGIEIDEISIASRLEKDGLLDEIGGYKVLTGIGGRVETSAHLQHWIEIVKERFRMWSLNSICKSAIEHISEAGKTSGEVMTFLENEILALGTGRKGDIITSKELAPQIKEYIENFATEGGMIGISSGLFELDRMLRGFKSGEMIVIGGRPGIGKTSLLLRFVEAAAQGYEGMDRAGVLFVSLEMGAKELGTRYISQRTRSDLQRVLDGDVEKQETMLAELSEFAEAPIVIVDNPDLDIHRIRSIARTAKRQHGVGLILIDYLQIVAPVKTVGQGNRVEEVAYISRSLKAMARELNIPVVVASQFNRELEKTGRRPRLSDLKESGAIEQDCDVAVLLHTGGPEDDLSIYGEKNSDRDHCQAAQWTCRGCAIFVRAKAYTL